MAKDIKGLVLDIQRMSTEDGPGLRTTVFLKGCPLKCEWCHNPESISPAIELEYFADRCIGCGLCIENCTAAALSAGNEGVIRDSSKCLSCLSCSINCPAAAVKTRGEYYSSRQLVDELIKDRAYFGSDGGVTISGGEALYQADFTAEVCRLLKEEGVKTAVDTCGLCSFGSLEKVLPYTDLFLYDIKILDSALHRQYTGADNRIILDNLIRLASLTDASTAGASLWIRTPVIPGATDTDENISGIARFIERELKGSVERWELCAFNNLCTAKYGRFGITWKYRDAPLQAAERMEQLREHAVNAGLEADRVFATGMTG